MAAVGIRELRNKLSLYLKQVEQGTWIEVTNRGEVIALLIPARGRSLVEELLALMEEGSASWKGGKPQGAAKPVKGRGRPLAEIIVEDRR
jgi:prevent-host-death family protein